MPDWVSRGFEQYATRMPPECTLVLKELAAQKRGKRYDLERVKQKEAECLLAAIPPRSYVIALEVQGRRWSTEQLAQELQGWQREGRDVVLLVGGPEGLNEACRQRADVLWSLSPLTFPHPLVRVILAEQIYRAWSIVKGHPYHRA